jgi:hypothetical protein
MTKDESERFLKGIGRGLFGLLFWQFVEGTENNHGNLK